MYIHLAGKKNSLLQCKAAKAKVGTICSLCSCTKSERQVPDKCLGSVAMFSVFSVLQNRSHTHTHTPEHLGKSFRRESGARSTMSNLQRFH